MTNIISAQNVKKYYGSKAKIVTALDDVSIDIEKNKNTAIVGETGSGKTTLGRITCGLEKASQGVVKLDGVNIKNYKPLDLWRKVQYVHQDPYSAIDSLETVGNLLSNPLRYLSNIRDENEIKNRIANTLMNTGLNETYADKKGGELSGGEIQRVLIARAFIMNPEYVVVDEPTTMIDFIHRNEIIETLRRVGDTFGTTLLLITHDVAIVPKIARRVAVIYQGKILEQGSTDDIIKKALHPYTIFLISIKPEKLANDAKILNYVKSFGAHSQAVYVRGCRYSNLCPLSDQQCKTEEPRLMEYETGHYVACFKPGELQI
ncbi:MAG: oligopeptide/dipeptide ABC transporter ATP-binding protein [Cuniculiplasma sp.]